MEKLIDYICANWADVFGPLFAGAMLASVAFGITKSRFWTLPSERYPELFQKVEKK